MRSAERLEFLRDIMITAAYGGVSDWAYLADINYQEEGNYYESYRLICEDDTGECIGSTKDHPVPTCPGHVITPDVVATGLLRAIGRPGSTCKHAGQVTDTYSQGIGWHYSQRKHVIDAARENDGGEIDAYDASCIVQLALFGTVIVG